LVLPSLARSNEPDLGWPGAWDAWMVDWLSICLCPGHAEKLIGWTAKPISLHRSSLLHAARAMAGRSGYPKSSGRVFRVLKILGFEK